MLSKQERDIQSIQSQLAALQAELGTELLSQLNTDEQEEVYIHIMSCGSTLHHCMLQNKKIIICPFCHTGGAVV